MSAKQQQVSILGIETILGSQKTQIHPEQGDFYVYTAGEEQSSPRALAREVVGKLLRRFPEVKQDIGVVINGSCFPADHLAWSMSSWIQKHFELPQASYSFCVYQGCVGFVQAASLARNLIAGEGHDAVLIFASEWLEQILPHRLQKPLHWSDGAVAALVTRQSDDFRGHKPVLELLGTGFETDGKYAELSVLYTGNRRDIDWSHKEQLRFGTGASRDTWKQWAEERSAVYEHAVRRAVQNAGLELDDIDALITTNPGRMDEVAQVGTYARASFMQELAERVPFKAPLTSEGHVVTVDVPRKVMTFIDNGTIKPGSIVLGVAGGTGFHVGAMVCRVN